MIIILTQCFPSRVGGIENLMHNLSISLGVHTKVLVLADTYDTKSDSKFDSSLKKIIDIQRTSGLKIFRRRKKIKLLKSIINNKKVSCVIGDSWKSFELAIDFLNLSKTPTICLAHGNELIIKNNNQLKRLQNTLNKVSSIICNSDFTKGLVNKLEIKLPIVKRIYPGADDTRLIREKKVSHIYGSPIILTLSRIEIRKGHQLVISSLLRLKKKFPKIQYVIAGVGPELDNLKKEVKNLGLESHVIFVGNINNMEKNFILNRTDLMVMPTIDQISNRSIEGFGISYIEAAFYAIPSIATNVGGTSEAVLDNKTGIILENMESLYEKLNLLLSDSTLLLNLGKTAQKRASEKFKWTIVVKEYLNLINKLNKNKK